MLYWATTLVALDPEDGQLKRWQGPHIPGITYEDAQKYIRVSNMGYLTIIGQLVADSREHMDPYKTRLN